MASRLTTASGLSTPANRRYLPLLGPLLASLVLCLPRLWMISLWSDEYHTVQAVRLPYTQIIAGQYLDSNNPPLYFLALKAALDVVGETETAMRLFSLVFYLSALVLVYAITLEWTGKPLPALAASWLVAFHPRYIWFSTEVRAYALLFFLTMLALYSYLRMRRTTSPAPVWAILLILSLAGCLYVHHFGIFVPPALLVFIFFDWLSRRSQRSLLPAAPVTLAVLLYAPYGSSVLLKQANAYTHNSGSLIPPSTFLQIFTFSFQRPVYESLLPVLSIMAFTAGWALWLRRDRWTAISIGLVVAGAAGGMLLLYWKGFNLLPRYLLHLTPLFFMVAAETLSMPWNSPANKTALTLGAAMVLMYTLYGIQFAALTPREDELATFKANWRQVSQVISELRREGEPAVVMSWDSRAIQYYLDYGVIDASQLEIELAQGPRCSYLVVLTPNSPPPAYLSDSSVLYEDKPDGIRILRLIPSACPGG
jgi:uncharacterized membrane protein